MYVCIVARDLPGGKRILIIKMRAQHITFSKAIKAITTVAHICNARQYL